MRSPHGHILFWSDLDTQDVHVIETALNVSYLKDFPEDEAAARYFQRLMNPYQVNHHSKSCRLPDGKCQFDDPQDIYEHTRRRGHNHLFARGDEEMHFIPHDHLLLAYFRCHYVLDVIHSGQCIGYVLKYCPENSAAGCVPL
jgi:hypothetical protein